MRRRGKCEPARKRWFLSRYRPPAEAFDVSALNVAAVGRNLHLWTNAPDIDPETAFDASNVQGIEFANFPTARSVGFAFKVTP